MKYISKDGNDNVYCISVQKEENKIKSLPSLLLMLILIYLEMKSLVGLLALI